jgi:uncharacterized membrane protein YagU involved in acid resistance
MLLTPKPTHVDPPTNRADDALNSCVNGVVAGLIATAPMTWTIRAAQALMRRRHGNRIPPRQVAEAVLHKAAVDDDLPPRRKDAVATLSHYAFGAVAGALVGAATKNSPLPKPVTGALVGLGVWSASYLGWLPAAGLRKSATDDTPQRNAQMILAHLVWGATAALLIEDLGVEDRQES